MTCNISRIIKQPPNKRWKKWKILTSHCRPYIVLYRSYIVLYLIQLLTDLVKIWIANILQKGRQKMLQIIKQVTSKSL